MTGGSYSGIYSGGSQCLALIQEHTQAGANDWLLFRNILRWEPMTGVRAQCRGRLCDDWRVFTFGYTSEREKELHQALARKV
eukprot:1583909-Pyramimonas_sp.AAC.1